MSSALTKHFRVNGRSAVVATVVVFKWLDELLEVELLVYLDQKMLGVDEVTHPLGGELEEPRVSAVAVQLIEHFYRPYREMFVPF